MSLLCLVTTSSFEKASLVRNQSKTLIDWLLNVLLVGNVMIKAWTLAYNGYFRPIMPSTKVCLLEMRL